MATQEEWDELHEQFRPIVEAAIARGEDLSTPDLMLAFVIRVLEHNGYVERPDGFVLSLN